jgi:hypothetical protein
MNNKIFLIHKLSDKEKEKANRKKYSTLLKDNLKVKRRIHFSCLYAGCDKVFKQKSRMRVHFNIHVSN